MIYRTFRHRYGGGIGPIVISWSTLRCACNLLFYCSHYLCILRDACETEMASCCLFQPSQSSTGDLGSASHFYTHPWGGRNFKIVSWVSGGYDMNLGFKWSAITHRSILLTFLHQDYGTHLGPEEMIYEPLDCVLGLREHGSGRFHHQVFSNICGVPTDLSTVPVSSLEIYLVVWSTAWLGIRNLNQVWISSLSEASPSSAGANLV